MTQYRDFVLEDYRNSAREDTDGTLPRLVAYFNTSLLVTQTCVYPVYFSASILSRYGIERATTERKNG